MVLTFSVSLSYQENILFYLKDKKGMNNNYLNFSAFVCKFNVKLP